MHRFHLDTVLLPDGWAEDVRVDVGPDGIITAVTVAPTGSAPEFAGGDGAADDAPAHAGTGEVRRLGTVVPGVPNLHSHAFQRAMAGRTERRGPGEDSFWSWREVMYAFVDRLDPDDVEAIAALVQVEMLESGFTSVGEFHYLHHDPDGRPYADPAETGGRICAAAARTGIGLTLLPVLYRHGGFGPTPPTHGQRRFVSDADLFADLMASARRHVAAVPGTRLGIAPHSLRATTVQDIREALPLASDGPVHVHVAEQTAEVDACLATHGARPVAHLLEHLPVDGRWCLIHATHMEASEVRAAAATGAVAGLCPVTEANLGDGFFPAREWFEAGGRIGVGSDSNVRIDLADELRTLEYGRRLSDRRRNVLAHPGGSTGRRLFEAALDGGVRALGGAVAGIAPGAPADFVELDRDHPRLLGLDRDDLLDGWLFGADGRVVQSVHVRGREVVRDGRAVTRPEVDAAWRRALGRMGVSPERERGA